MAETKVSDPIITFKNVSKTYTLYKDDKARFKALFFKPRNAKTNKALNNVSMVINRGESVGIVGDNGAGKSTLLKMITGVAFPDEGEITVDGKVAALLELTAGFSMEMTGRENIYLKGYVLGLEDSYIKQIEEKIIDFAELGDYIDQPVRTYSSGMKMRLGFAINVNIEPDVLVVDEAQQLFPIMENAGQKSLKITDELIKIDAETSENPQLTKRLQESLVFQLNKKELAQTTDVKEKTDTLEKDVKKVLGEELDVTEEQIKKAMEELQKDNPDKNTATNEMCSFLILNISSLQLIPINIIAYRSQYGSVNPSKILIPGLIATLGSTIVAVIYIKWKDRKR